MDINNLLVSFFLTIIILYIFCIFYRQSKKKKLNNGFIVVLHMVVLALYFTNSFSLPYVFFDTIWWTMTGAGIICCINLFKEKSKWLFLLVPSTFIFIQILPITLLLNDI